MYYRAISKQMYFVEFEFWRSKCRIFVAKGVLYFKYYLNEIVSSFCQSLFAYQS